jgi:hypothetical protein
MPGNRILLISSKRLHENDDVFHARGVDDVEAVCVGSCLEKCVFR